MNLKNPPVGNMRERPEKKEKKECKQSTATGEEDKYAKIKVTYIKNKQGNIMNTLKLNTNNIHSETTDTPEMESWDLQWAEEQAKVQAEAKVDEVVDTLIFDKEYFTEPSTKAKTPSTQAAFGEKDKAVFVEGFGESRYQKPVSDYQVTVKRIRKYLKRVSDAEVVGLTPRRLSEVLDSVINNWRHEARELHGNNGEAYCNFLSFKRKALDSVISPIFKQQARAIKGVNAHDIALSWDDEISNLHVEFGFGLYPTEMVSRSDTGFPVYDQCSMVDCLSENATGLSKRNANGQWVENVDRYEAHETLEAIQF